MATSALVQSALAAAVLCLVLPSASSIMCYHCNSYIWPECTNVKHSISNSSSPSEIFKDCEKNEKGLEPFCRKTVIRVVAQDATRVVRGCGWERHKYGCYQVDDGDHQEVVCQCFTDGCNSAPPGSLSSPAILLGLVTAAVTSSLRC